MTGTLTPIDQVRRARADAADTSAQTEFTWPTIDSAAFYGPAGRIVAITDPHTEADPVAILMQVIVAIGNAIGRGPHFIAEADKHYTNEFAVFVGDTSKARKGSSFGQARRALELADETWSRQVQTGLVSGEGLIFHVRDKVMKENKKGEIEVVDEGVVDKRLMVFESEFARTLRILERESNTLSAVVRDAWDRGDLQTMAKNSPIRATGAHTSIIGHTTIEELKRYLSDTEMANGFANRFMWFCVQRSKVLPDPEPVPQDMLIPVAQEIRDAIEDARHVGMVRRNDEARKIWNDVYPELSEGKPGLAGSMIARGEAHVMRLALIYALLDRKTHIHADHLRAALAVWEYCEESVAHIFGDRLGDPVADRIATALLSNPAGMTRTEISAMLGRNVNSGRIDAALDSLSRAKKAHLNVEATEGRSVERWLNSYNSFNS